jgi:5-methylcytosine-specific restriction endonuclease McrA
MVKAKLCIRCGKLSADACQCKAVIYQASTTRNGYDRKWQRFRKRVVMMRAKQGKLVCAMCGSGFGNVSPHADHIIPVAGQDDALFFDESNIQLLHPRCHGIKTKQDMKAGKTR